MPSATRALGDTLVPLDAGDFFDYDELSRFTNIRRGGALGGAVDPALSVAIPGYDLASRPASEVVGSRDPWVVDLRQQRELSLERLDVEVAGKRAVEELESDVPTEVGVSNEKHLPRAAATELAQEAVARSQQILWPTRG